jgi:hypothetical protein
MARLLVTVGLVTALLGAGCGAKGPEDPSKNGACKNALSTITVGGATGVMLPSAVARKALLLRRKDATDFWYPSEDDARDVESGLADALKERLASARREPPSPGRDRDIASLEHISAHLQEYLRQYAGIIVNGSRRVLVNAFPRDVYCWRDDYVLVEDGGNWFWNIQYDVQLHQFLHWELAGK